MFSVVIAAAALAFANAAPAAATQKPAPLREIVYKFSFDRKVERSVEEFGAPNLNVGGTNTFSGKLTVDVTQVGDDGSIRVSATEAIDRSENMTKPITADIVIRTNGDLVIVGGETEDDMTTLLPYLATKYFADHDLREGAGWKEISAPGKTQTTTTYSVSNVGADTATVSSVAKATGGSVSGPLSIESKVVYKASLLVPLSLDIVVLQSGNTTTGGRASTVDTQTHYHFDRTADTRDTAGSGR
jgi:hypothetical protein